MSPSISRISIVIPALNEAANLAATIISARSDSTAEVIVVDGGSSDATATLAESLGAVVLKTEPGRARQMNAGAQIATGEVLLFLHADTRLPEGFDHHVHRILAQPGTVAGAFLLGLDGPQRGLRVIEWLANWRSRKLQMPYGDQAIFMRADLFREAGGFPEMPLMEDFELVRRFRRQGRIVIAPVRVVSSARRWMSLGIWRTTLINQIVIAAYLAGVSPYRIARWYDSDRERASKELERRLPPIEAQAVSGRERKL